MIPDMKTDPKLLQLLEEAKRKVDAMTPQQRAEMFRHQREGWVKSEMQWAKDFREGKCQYD